MQFGINFVLKPTVPEVAPVPQVFGIQWIFQQIIPETGEVRILFKDTSTSVGLAGITFALYDEQGTLIGNYTSGTGGIAELDNLLPGVYRIRQAGEVAGYLPFDDVLFTVVAGVQGHVSIGLLSTQGNTRWMDLYNLLKVNGLEVYPPASKRGICLSPYVVPLQENTMQFYGYSSDQDIYSVLCYVPLEQYVEVQKFVNMVKLVMKRAYPKFQPTGNVTQPYLDTAVQGWMVSIEYVNYRKVNLLY